MAVHVLHALARGLAVLHGDVEGLGAVEPGEGALHARHGEEQVGDFVRGEVRQARAEAQRADEDVAREEGFEVYQGEGVGCCVEDLGGGVSWRCSRMGQAEGKGVLGR